MADPNENVATVTEVMVKVLPRYIAAGKACKNPAGCSRSSGAEFELPNGRTYCGQHISVALRTQRTLADWAE